MPQTLRAAVGFLLLAVQPSCSNETGELQNPARVSIYGIDGATWSVIDPMIANGELPNLQRLIETGVRAPLRSRKPLASPPVWTTIATGVTRDVHGIRNFVVKGAKARKRSGGRLVSSRDRKAHALWTIATEFGVNSAVIGWWATYPAETVEGVMVSERAFKTRERDLTSLFGGSATTDSALVHPPEILPALVEIIAETPHDVSKADVHAMALRSVQIEDRAIARSLRFLRKQKGPFRLEMTLMRGVDVVSHHFWKFYEPEAPAYEERNRPSAQEIRELGATVTEHYQFVDRLIGELIADMRPEDIALIVSDHGFEAGMQPYRKGLLSGTHKSDAALNGIFIASGGPFRQDARLDTVSILDIAPTVLRVLGLPIADAIRGKAREDAMEPGWIKKHEAMTIPRYQGAPVSLPDASSNEVSPLDDAMLEQLRGLGYLE